MSEEGGSGVLRQLIAVFGFEVEDEELDKGENRLEEFFEKIKGLGKLIAGAFAVGEVMEFVESNVHAMTAIEHTAAALGLTTDKVQELQFAEKSLGFETGTITGLLGRMQVAANGAATGAGGAGDAFAKIGVHVKDANGHVKAADVLFGDVADAIAKETDASKQAAIATQIFGRSGRQLLPILKEGREGVEQFADEFRKLGGGYTREAIEQGAKFERQSARLDFALRGVKDTILRALLPVVTRLTQAFADAVKWFGMLAKNTYIVQAALIVLGSAAAYFAAGILAASAPLLIWAGALAAVVIAVDELINLFDGNKTVIGETIDKLFGKGTSTQAVQDLKEAWKEVAKWIEAGGKAIGEMVGAYKYFQAMNDRQEKERRDRATEALGGGTGWEESEDVGTEGGYDKWGVPTKGGQFAWDGTPAIGGAGPESVSHAPQSLPFQAPNMGGFQSVPLGGALQSSEGVTVNIDKIEVKAPDGTDPKNFSDAIGYHLGPAIDKHLAQRHRAAASTLHRAKK